MFVANTFNILKHVQTVKRGQINEYLLWLKDKWSLVYRNMSEARRGFAISLHACITYATSEGDFKRNLNDLNYQR